MVKGLGGDVSERQTNGLGVKGRHKLGPGGGGKERGETNWGKRVSVG